MTFVTVDGDMVAKLNGLTDFLVFRDEKGNVLGKFQPDENSPLVREWLRTVTPTISEEEMQRRKQQEWNHDQRAALSSEGSQVSYEVYWSPDMLEQLQRIHDAVLDQEGMRNTVTRIELELGKIPHEAGESRDRGRRVLFKFPLLVWYRIDERLRQVIITDVRPFGI